MARPFALRLIEDLLAPGGHLLFPVDGVNRIVYVVHGAIEIARKAFSDDESWHGSGAAKVAATSIGATVWRWEFAPAQSKPAMLERPNGTSVEKLASLVSLPASDVLMRNDSVSFPPGGCAFLHTHQGPGIRCLIEGGIRIDTEGRSASAPVGHGSKPVPRRCSRKQQLIGRAVSSE
jgi:hypothetical protein